MVEYELITGETVKAYSNYEQAKKDAEGLGLKLAEYGDIYGSKLSYCYWNESGNRNDTERIIAYYTFNKQGKPQAITEEELREYLFN